MNDVREQTNGCNGVQDQKRQHALFHSYTSQQ
jgi:hypothetical protein